MRYKWRTSLYMKTVLYFLLVALIPFITAGFLGLNYAKGELAKKLQNYLADRTSSLAQRVEGELNRSFEKVVQFSRSDQMTKGKQDNWPRTLAQFQSQMNQCRSLHILGVDGKVLASQGKGDPPLVKVSPIEKDNLPQPSLEKLQLTSRGEVEAVLVVPLVTKEPVGYLVAVLSLEKVRNLLSEQRFAGDPSTVDQYAALVNPQGFLAVVGVEPLKKEVLEKNYNRYSSTKLALQGKRGAQMENLTAKGKAFFGYAPVTLNEMSQPWALLVVLDEKEAWELFSQFYEVMIIVVLAIFLLCLAAGTWYAYSIVRPLKKVAQAAERLSENSREDTTLNFYRRDEIGYLAETFNKLHQNLKERKKVEKKALQALHQAVGSVFDQIQRQSKDISSQIYTASKLDVEITDLSQAAGKFTQGLPPLSRSSEKAMEELRDGLRSLQNLQTDLGKLEKHLTRSQERAEQMSKHLGEMTTLRQSFSEVQDKLELISLNTSIEAARLGEGGRGLESLAQELKALAERLENTLEGSRDSFDQLHRDTDFIGNLTESMNSAHEDFEDRIGSSLGTIEEMRELSRLLLEYSGQLMRPARDQSDRIQRVLSILTEVEQISQEFQSSIQKMVGSLGKVKENLEEMAVDDDSN